MRNSEYERNKRNMKSSLIAFFAALLCTVCAAAMSVLGANAASPQWISGDSAEPEKPAPSLVREFHLGGKPTNAVFTVAVAGWCEVTVNGEKAGRNVLQPVTCQPDRRNSSLRFDVTDLLKAGTNTLEVLLGNGWQNSFTIDAWGFHEAPWRSSPKIRGELTCDGMTLFATDGSWTAYDSPIVFNSLRNGEKYDARMEGSRVNERPAKVEKYAPWGVVSAEDAVPCREGEIFDPKTVLKTPYGKDVYDFGANIAGWCEIEVEGEAGAKVIIDYDESVTSRNTLLGYVKTYTNGRGEKRPVQHDEYTLAGRCGGERWHPRFTYHGFRYAMVRLEGDVRLKSVKARFVHSALEMAGCIETSDATFSALQSATMRSYLSNFVGIPTDCPHREKLGWTGDTHLAMETGLWNYDAKDSYVHFLRMMLDAQRPNGAVPCILPCTPKFGFFWGSGPAYDAILFELPWQIYRFYGDDAPAREAYDAMKRYLAYMSAQADEDGLYAYGLGDWNNWYKDMPGTPVRLTDSEPPPGVLGGSLRRKGLRGEMHSGGGTHQGRLQQGVLQRGRTVWRRASYGTCRTALLQGTLRGRRGGEGRKASCRGGAREEPPRAFRHPRREVDAARLGGLRLRGRRVQDVRPARDARLGALVAVRRRHAPRRVGRLELAQPHNVWRSFGVGIRIRGRNCSA